MATARVWRWTGWISSWCTGEQALIQLLDPPFDQSELNPGYIKGYVPGVRGMAQTLMGAIWRRWRSHALGDRRRAWELLALINPGEHGDRQRR